MNTIVLAVDRLHAGYVGAYGNTWIETPALDRLAFQSFVFDEFLVPSPGLEAVYRAYWQGLHPLLPSYGDTAVPALPGLLSASLSTALLTDEPHLARPGLANGFGAVVEIDEPPCEDMADEVHETHLARVFARLVDWLDSARPPLFLWCHMRGMGGPWDAPIGFRGRYVEPGDPEPLCTADLPDRILTADDDPDELLAITQAYAGQVTLFDECLGGLMEFLDGGPLAQDTLLVVLSPRGFPLGEHGRVGVAHEALYGELLQVPLLMRLPHGLGAAGRCHGLACPADVRTTLLDWHGLAPPPEASWALSLLPVAREDAPLPRDRLCLVRGESERAIRTPAWYLRQSDKPELFAKPDDRWEANDVADRCPGVADEMLQAFQQFDELLRAGKLGELPPLPEVLRVGLE